MKVEKDYEELLGLFNKHRVRYCIVGAYAVAFHAIPRYTKDMDILIEPNIENGRRIIRALNEFGFKSLNLTEKDFSQKGKVIQLGYEPVRVDIITSIGGCRAKDIWRNRVRGLYGRHAIFFIGLNELIKNKRSSPRKQDILDIEKLEPLLKKKKI